jgi:hypothetical protein
VSGDERLCRVRVGSIFYHPTRIYQMTSTQ